MIKQYKTIRPDIEAVQWTGENQEEIKILLNNKVSFMAKYGVLYAVFGNANVSFVDAWVSPGDWIVKFKLDGACIPVNAFIFSVTYKEVV